MDYSVLRRAGVLEKLRETGLNSDSMTWRRLDGSEIANLTGLNSRASEKGGFIMYPVHDLARFFLEELYKWPSATVHWGHKVASVGQNDTSAWVDVEGGMRLEADFVIGCDGATSIVRKTLFGKNFPGKTLDKILVATNVIRQRITYLDGIARLANVCRRYSMTLISLDGRTCRGLSILTTGALSATFRETAGGASLTEKPLGFPSNN